MTPTEEAASQAEDTLALYRYAKADMIGFLSVLHRGSPCNDPSDLIMHMLSGIEHCVFTQFGWSMPDSETIAGRIHRAVGVGDDAGAAMDCHFNAYLAYLRQVIGRVEKPSNTAA